MLVKELLKGSVVLITAALLASSCDKSGSEPDKDYSFSANVVSQDFDGIKVDFTAGDGIATIQYFCGSQLRCISDSMNFENGAAKGIKTVDAAAGSFTVTPDAASPTAIFIKPLSSDGVAGKTVCLKSVASPVQYAVSKASLGSFVYSIPEEIGSDYLGLSILAMSEEAPEEWGMTVEEIIGMYIDFGMLEPATPGTSSMVELNGEPDYGHIAGVVYWKKDGNVDIKTFKFKTGTVISNAEKATIDVKVNNIAEESADLVFTPGEATYGYFYAVYTKTEYNNLLEDAKKMGLNPDSYVRDICAAAGTMEWEKKTDSRTYFSSKTDYVLVCYPFNVNGTQGWGDSVIVNFTTK